MNDRISGGNFLVLISHRDEEPIGQFVRGDVDKPLTNLLPASFCVVIGILAKTIL